MPPYSATEDERAAEGSASRKGKEKEDSGGFGSLFRSIISVFTPQVEPLVSALCQACMVGSIPQVKGLLSQGANVNSINEDGRTPLMCAVRADQVEVARLLIQEGAAIGHSGRKFGSQRPALYHAAECGSLASMRLLLEKGADPNVRSGWPGQPFFADIVTSGSLEAARLLLDHGVDPNTREMTGMPVLSRAIQEGREPFVKLLLERGADANCRNAMGLPMVVDCIKSGKLAMARLLLMYRADPNSRDLSGTPVLLHAIMSRNEEAAMMLLDYGADANASCWSGHNALVLAVQARMAPLVKKLLERGANPNQKVDDAYGGMCGHRCSGQASNQQSLLLWTLYNTLYDSDRLELARLLLVHGADVRRKSAIGSCALVYAVAHGKRELARLLLEHGADPNASPGSGQSLLLFAVEQSDEPMAQLLLKHGADANFSTASSGGSSSGRGSGLTGDPNGLTPLMVAVDRGDIEVVRTLVKHGADINRESAVTTEPASSVSQTVVAARHPPEIAVGSSSTPLQRARQLGFHDIVTVLQRGGAVGSARSQGGRGGRWASTGGNSRTSTSRSSGTRVAVSGCAASGADSPAEQQRLLSPTTVSRASLVDTNMGEVPPPDYDSTVAVSPGAQASTRN